MQTDMKLSFTTMGTPGRAPEQVIDLATQFGFQGVDPRLSAHLGEIRSESTRGEIEKLGTRFRNAGLAIPSLLAYTTVPKESADIWGDFEREVRSELQVATWLGAQRVRIGTPKLREDLPIGAILDRVPEIIMRVLKEDLSPTQVAIQNHAGHCNSLQVVEMAERVGNPRFGLIFSPEHTLLTKEGDFEEVRRRVFPWTQQLYLADLAFEGPKHHHALPGEGDVPLRETIHFFEEKGYTGFYSFKWEKIWAKQIPEAEDAFPKFLEFMRNLA
jgi:sugar phosphate isomerase/epimerase